jgi:hypothetical protein
MQSREVLVTVTTDGAKLPLQIIISDQIRAAPRTRLKAAFGG